MNLFENAKVGDKVLFDVGYNFSDYNVREISGITSTGNIKIGTMIFKKENGKEKGEYSRASIKPFDQKILDAQIENNMRMELSIKVANKLLPLLNDMSRGFGSVEQSKKLEALLTKFGYKS